MGNFIHKTTAWKCRIHQSVLRECARLLSEHGYFRKSSIVDKLHLEGVEQAIRWDYIVDFLEDKDGEFAMTICPVPERFFKDRIYLKQGDFADTEPSFEPSFAVHRYSAGGHGKKTTGYVRGSFSGGRFLLYRVERLADQINGTKKALKDRVERGRRDPSIEPEVAADMRKRLPFSHAKRSNIT